MEKTTDNHAGIGMYFDPEVSFSMAELEQNPKHKAVADAFDIITTHLVTVVPNLRVAELGGGAHPDRYPKLFDTLTKVNGKVDWVDISPLMLEHAVHYLNTLELKERENLINFVNSDICGYLARLDPCSLNLCLMKYTFDHMPDLELLFELLSKALSNGGYFISDLSLRGGQLRPSSTNARFHVYDPNAAIFIPLEEPKALKHGDEFMLKFFRISGDPDSGYLPGGEVIKYFYDPIVVKEIAEKQGFEIQIAEWKTYLPENQIPQNMRELNLEMIVAKKKG